MILGDASQARRTGRPKILRLSVRMGLRRVKGGWKQAGAERAKRTELNEVREVKTARSYGTK